MSGASEVRQAPSAAGVVAVGLLHTLRARQWTKNSVVFAALLFSKHLDDSTSLLRSVAAFGVFCLLSSTVYLLNDVFDLASDRRHPTKRLRPVAAGVVPPALAAGTGLVLGIGGLIAGWLLQPRFALAGAVYLAANLMYSAWLKKVVIVDVMVISAGFVLRAVAGGLAIDVEVSGWLILCTILLSLFLALGKRRQELALLQDAAQHRSILSEYSVAFLDQMITIVTAATLVAYCSYTLSEEVRHKAGTDLLYLTVPFVIYGIFRYLYLVHKREMGGNPTEALLSDPPLMVDIALWAGAAALILYLT